MLLVIAVVYLQSYRLPESCIRYWYDKPSAYGCVSKSVGCGSITLLYLVPSPSTPTYTVKKQDLKHYDSHH